MNLQPMTRTDDANSAPRTRGRPRRTCVGCRTEDAPDSMLRFVAGPEAEPVVDLASSAFGRGVWVHSRPDCLRGACRSGFSKALRTPVRITAESLGRQLSNAAQSRVIGLIVAARRAGRLALGTEAGRIQHQRGRVELLIVATDARNAAKQDWVQCCAGAGLAMGWGTKQVMGSILGRTDTALVVVTERGLARAIRRAAECEGLGRQLQGDDTATSEGR